MAFVNISTEVVDAKSGYGALIDDNSQDFDIRLENGKEYSFALKIDIGIMSGLNDSFTGCETPEDIESELREIFATGDYHIEAVVAAHPMDEP